MESKESIFSKEKIEYIYSRLNLKIELTNNEILNRQSFVEIASNFKWPKMFYPSIYPLNNSLSSSTNSIEIKLKDAKLERNPW